MRARGLKAFGLATLTALALAGGGTSGAQAAPFFEADAYPVTVEATTVEAASVFTFGGFYQFECANAPFLGEMSVTSSALTFSASTKNAHGPGRSQNRPKNPTRPLWCR